jgi:hypothetical protein
MEEQRREQTRVREELLAPACSRACRWSLTRSGAAQWRVSLSKSRSLGAKSAHASGHVYSPTMCTSIDVDDHCARDRFFCSTSASL